MNREILFRIKSVKDWVYGLPLNIKEKTVAFEGVLEDGSTWYDAICDRQTLGQFTGLTDKKDKKIFEGDVVELKHKGKKVTGQVTYKYCRFKIDSKGIGYSLTNLFLLSQPDIEVIGNIHDNPELLEENDEKIDF